MFLPRDRFLRSDTRESGATSDFSRNRTLGGRVRLAISFVIGHSGVGCDRV